MSLPSGPSERIEMANGEYIFSHGSGLSKTFGEALYVPDLATGLISTSQDDLSGLFSVYGKKKVSVYSTEPIPTSKPIRTGTLIGGSQYVANDVNRSFHANSISSAWKLTMLTKIFTPTR